MSHVEENQSMDAAANAQTRYSLPVGASFRGVFSGNLDQDWVRVELVAGTTYRISLSGSGDNSGADTVLRVFNAAGEQVAVNDDADFAAGQLNSTLSFTPESSGVYYLSAGAYTGNPNQDHSGAYTLTLVDPEADGVVEPGPGYVELEGGAGNDVLRGGAGDDVIQGGDGNDMLYGLGGQDFLTGGRGDDLLEGGDDADLLLGDSASAFFFEPLLAHGEPGSGSSGSSPDDPATGDDPGNGTAPDDPSAMGDGVAEAGGSSGSSAADPSATAADDDDGPITGYDPYTGGDDDPHRDDPLPLFPSVTRDDVLAFLSDQLHAGNDVLRGGAGSDWIEGGAGDDELFGGDDDDLLIGDNSLMMFFGGLPVAVVNDDPDGGAGAVPVPEDDDENGGADFAAPAGDEDPGAFDNLLLMLLIDQLTAGDDLLDGGPGDDTLEGGFGNDTLVGGTGDDTLEGGPGADDLDAGSGDDYLRGGGGDDALNGGSGDDWLEGSAGDDVLEGGDGNDHLSGDDFPWFLFFEPVAEGPAADHPHADGNGDGASVALYDPNADDSADDGPAITGYDPYTGGDDDDGPVTGYDPSLISILVPWGDDVLSGGAGDDLLDGGPGNDTLSGGPGADIFILMQAGGYDVVTDFHAGEDKIDLSAFAGIGSTDDLALHQQGDDLVIDLSAHDGGEVTLQGIDEADLSDAHFIFSGDSDAAIA